MPERNEINAVRADAQAKQKLLSMIGFAMRAGKLVCGTDKICDEIRRHGMPDDGVGSGHPIGIVLLTADASANTKKRIINACTYYRVTWISTALNSEELASRIGKAAAAACATFDKGFADGMKKAVDMTCNNRQNKV